MVLTELSSDPAIAAAENRIQIVPASLELLESFRACLDSVARERKWLGLVEAPPADQVQEFWKKHFACNDPAFFALAGSRVVGFIDIKTNEQEGSRHRGHLGMGIHRDFRGQGIGTRLMRAAIEKARQKGLMRIDLSVYASNPAAAVLYRNFGFTEEGRMVKGRYIDGRFDDVIQMGLILKENLPSDGQLPK